jgi:hypothetical protein
MLLSLNYVDDLDYLYKIKIVLKCFIVRPGTSKDQISPASFMAPFKSFTLTKSVY